MKAISNEQMEPIRILESAEDIEYLALIVRRLLGESGAVVHSWDAESINPGQLNFTTSGIYRIHGAATAGEAVRPWSLILKIIKPDSSEKEDVSYHNYWKREAEIFTSGILDHLPRRVVAPDCYAVQNRLDDTIALWMEDVAGHYERTHVWHLDDWSWVAECLGEFHGAYLTETELPQHEWVCPAWLKSWVRGCRQYSPEIIEPCFERSGDDPAEGREKYPGMESKIHDQAYFIWRWFTKFSEQMDELLVSLERLPRVLSHQDLGQGNIFLPSERNHETLLTLIDWQFMSLSGIGEELGKLYGVNASLGHIAEKDVIPAKEKLFESYIYGLRTAGWSGDERIARYGYCVGVAARSMWEVPQWLKWVEEIRSSSNQNHELFSKIAARTQIISIQMDMAAEAAALANTIFFAEK
ncbi:phosphotransferase [Paenibacillus sp. NPDC057886]|uniref:phosphotransferase n=1 Tax=Paenibacillus sp. NPDC057886 TaxID=3346270 RepID=UPI0036B8C467